jgi:alkylhydroperoxidase/carboxymuconolactone decarboxylase family protein YurZ
MIETPLRQTARRRGGIDRRGVILIAIVLVLSLGVSRSCQQNRVRVSQQEAVATARKTVDFTPRRTQVRLVRQGLAARPYWAVSLSVPGSNGAFRQLATVRVDANTGKVAQLSVQPPAS